MKTNTMIFLSGAADPFKFGEDERRFWPIPHDFSEQALDAGVAAWFGVTKVEAERNFIRSRMGAAVKAVLEGAAVQVSGGTIIAQRTNFQNVAAMNAAFGNPAGDSSSIDWDRIRKQCLNIPDEVGELFVALGADQAVVKHLVSALKWAASKQVNPVDPDGVRDALCDVHVFGYGAHHLMGIDADADMGAVVDGVMTRFIKDDADKEATIAKHAAAGVTDVYFEGDYPTMVMKSATDQPDAPRGKFLKSASYREPVFTTLPAPQQGGAA